MKRILWWIIVATSLSACGPSNVDCSDENINRNKAAWESASYCEAVNQEISMKVQETLEGKNNDKK